MRPLKIILKAFSHNSDDRIHSISDNKYHAYISYVIFAVPEYEITEPHQSNKEVASGEWHYKMDAFGKEMHLKLRRNTQLVKPGLKLETRHTNGEVTRMPVKSDSYFHGTVSSDPGSLVAISNDKGLVSDLTVCDFFIG